MAAFALFGGPARAADFVPTCQGFVTAVNDGKDKPGSDKICACIKGKLTDEQQSAVGEELQKFIDAKKAGKEPGEPAENHKADLQAFIDDGNVCSKESK